MEQPRGLIHLPALDGLRGIAILAVLVGHFGRFPGIYALTKALVPGWLGVTLFFVLSGFLITRILLETRILPSYYKTFYARRALRIFPLYYAFLALGTVICLAFFGRARGEFLAELPWYATYLYNWRAAAGFGLPIIGHLWSLSVEEQFYAVWPFVIRHLEARSVFTFALAMIAVSAIARLVAVLTGFERYAYFSTLGCLEPLAYGALGAAFVHSRRVLSYRWIWRLAAGATLGIVAVALAARGFEPNKPLVLTAGVSAASLLFFCVVLLASGGKLPSLTASPLRTCGRLSYGLYLIHGPVGAAFLLRPGFVSAAGGLLCSFALAWLSYRYFESPILRLKPSYGLAKR